MCCRHRQHDLAGLSHFDELRDGSRAYRGLTNLIRMAGGEGRPVVLVQVDDRAVKKERRPSLLVGVDLDMCQMPAWKRDREEPRLEVES